MNLFLGFFLFIKKMAIFIFVVKQIMVKVLSGDDDDDEK